MPSRRDGRNVTYDLAEVFQWFRDVGREIGEDGEQGADVVNPSQEQALLARERRFKVAIDRRVKAGELVEAATVRRALFPVVWSLRDALLAVPDRVASTLAAEADERAVHAALSADLLAALDSATDELHAVAAGLSSADTVEDGYEADGGGRGGTGVVGRAAKKQQAKAESVGRPKRRRVG